MLNSIQKAFKVKEVRERLLYTFMMLIVIRIGSCLPIPGVDASFLKEFFTNLQNSGMGFVNAITGGLITLQGPHQVAKKSTKTGLSPCMISLKVSILLVFMIAINNYLSSFITVTL